jgi:hypothetical protein
MSSPASTTSPACQDPNRRVAPPAFSHPLLEVGDILLLDTDLRCYVLGKKDQMALLLPPNDAKMMSIDYIGSSVRVLLGKGFNQKMVIEVASLLNCFTDCFKAEEHMRKLMSIVQHNEHHVAVEYITSVWVQLSKSTSVRRNVAPNVLAPASTNPRVI